MGDVMLGVILLLVVGGWIITRVARSAARKATRLGEEQIARLTARLFALEQDRAKFDSLRARARRRRCPACSTCPAASLDPSAPLCRSL